MLATRSRFHSDDAGWSWLEPDQRSLMLRHGVVSLVLSLLLLAAAAAATIPPAPLAVVAFAAVAGLGAVIARQAWRESHTRLGVSDLGLLVQRATQQDQIGWPSVVAVTGKRHRRRVRVIVTTRTGRIVPAATFSRAPARRWLDECGRHAARRRLEPLQAPDGLGFVARDLQDLHAGD